MSRFFTQHATIEDREQEADVTRAAAQGLLFVQAFKQAIYADAKAVEILAYPEDPKHIRSLARLLGAKLKPVLSLAVREGYVGEVRSGRRRYRCRAFPISPEWGDANQNSGVALIMERCMNATPDASQIAERFRLTQREREVVLCLMKGLTSREIADHMSISPNTVKSFLRLIMVKMGVTTRTAIIGKIFEMA